MNKAELLQNVKATVQGFQRVYDRYTHRYTQYTQPQKKKRKTSEIACSPLSPTCKLCGAVNFFVQDTVAHGYICEICTIKHESERNGIIRSQKLLIPLEPIDIQYRKTFDYHKDEDHPFLFIRFALWHKEKQAWSLYFKDVDKFVIKINSNVVKCDRGMFYFVPDNYLQDRDNVIEINTGFKPPCTLLLFVEQVNKMDMTKRLANKILQNNLEKIELGRERIKKKLGEENQTPGISIQDYMTLSLVDGYKQTRINIPVRGKQCDHLQASDLMSTILSNRGNSRNPKCPVCKRALPWNEVYVDGYLYDILKQIKNDDVKEIEFDRVGNWKLHVKAHHDVIDLDA